MFPALHTEKYQLLEIVAGDRPFIFKGLSDPDVIPFYGVQYDSLEATRVQMDWYDQIWRERTGCWWKIVAKEDKQAIGACGMNGFNADLRKAEIGYWLLPAHWCRGVMKEVIPVMIEHLFMKWDLNLLEAVVEVGNIPSGQLAVQLGFHFEGVQKEAEIKQGRPIDLEIYTMRRDKAGF